MTTRQVESANPRAMAGLSSREIADSPSLKMQKYRMAGQASHGTTLIGITFRPLCLPQFHVSPTARYNASDD